MTPAPSQTLPRYGLMLGNFATGLCILAPAGMLTVLAEGLNVGIRETGLLVTFGAVILCFGSPLVAWLTTRIDRRTLLVGSLATAGISRLATATRLNSRLRGWEALSGITTLGVAAVIEAGLPEMSLWPLAFVIALDLVVEGATLANIGWAIRGERER